MNKTLKELLPYIIIFVVVMLVRAFIVTPIIVDGSSMEPTLIDGDMMLLYKLDKINRNDIVVIDNTQGHIIKRVIGLPGETIELKDDILTIDGKEYKDIYIKNTGDIEKLTLDDDEYYVLGDNRLVSEDSRSVGPIKKDEILGTTNIIIFPFNRFGII